MVCTVSSVTEVTEGIVVEVAVGLDGNSLFYDFTQERDV